MKQGHLSSIFSSLLLLAALQACNQSQPQQISNSPCATLDATIQVKPRADLSLMFGHAAIQTALDTIIRNVGEKHISHTPELTKLGMDAAVHIAEANGRILKPQDRAALEAYLRDEAIPAIRQNPACVFNVVAPAIPHFGIEKINLPPGQAPQIVIKNGGEGEGQAEVRIRQFVNGNDYSSGKTQLSLGPGQSRKASVPTPILPISDILAGKAGLVVDIEISNLPQPDGKRIYVHEAWKYEHSTQNFRLIFPK